MKSDKSLNDESKTNNEFADVLAIILFLSITVAIIGLIVRFIYTRTSNEQKYTEKVWTVNELSVTIDRDDLWQLDQGYLYKIIYFI